VIVAGCDSRAGEASARESEKRALEGNTVGDEFGWIRGTLAALVALKFAATLAT
jgi:hypothetical protein